MKTITAEYIARNNVLPKIIIVDGIRVRKVTRMYTETANTRAGYQDDVYSVNKVDRWALVEAVNQAVQDEDDPKEQAQSYVNERLATIAEERKALDAKFDKRRANNGTTEAIKYFLDDFATIDGKMKFWEHHRSLLVRDVNGDAYRALEDLVAWATRRLVDNTSFMYGSSSALQLFLSLYEKKGFAIQISVAQELIDELKNPPWRAWASRESQ